MKQENFVEARGQQDKVARLFLLTFQRGRGIVEVENVTHNPQGQHEVGKIKDITRDEVRQCYPQNN